MEQGRRLAYLVAGLAIILLIILLAFLATGQKKIVSPIPEEGIKVIFTSPPPSATPAVSPSPTASPKP